MADKTRNKDSAIPSEVNELIAESSTIQSWIDRLEVLKEDTRPEVFEKVRTDYRVRLDTVTAKLGEHRAGLLETLEIRRATLGELEAEREERDAELAEATLRHAVGEFSDDTFEERREAVEADLSGLDARLDDERAGVDELESILDAMPGEAGTDAPAAPPKSRARAATSDAADVVPAWMSSSESDDPAEESGATAVDAEAAADEESIVLGPDTKVVVGAASDADAPKADAPEADARKGDAASTETADDADYLDELEFLESLSLEDSERFDAVSAMLDDDDSEKGTGK